MSFTKIKRVPLRRQRAIGHIIRPPSPSSVERSIEDDVTPCPRVPLRRQETIRLSRDHQY